MALTHPLRIGLKLRPERYGIAAQRAVWRLADEAGFDHVWTYDHLVAVGHDPDAAIFECWSLLAAMAEGTTRVRIGAMVTGNLYRHPSLLAKIATTVDHLSGGRLEVGLGAGWNEPEFRMLGLVYAPISERIDRLDETCEVMRSLWTTDRAEFEGRYYRLEGAIHEPKPVQRPHPPIWIGGSGPRRTLRVVARHADAWNANGRTPEVNIASSAVLDEHARAIGRDPATIRRCAQLVWHDVDSTCREAEAYVGAGFSELILVIHPDRLPPDADPVRVADLIASRALPRLRELSRSVEPALAPTPS
jgi:F420-dependent oxidoreductase-like protein